MDQPAIDIEPRPFTGRHMAVIMVAFFGVIIAVNFTMAWLAGHTWTGLVVKNSYVASQKFNGQLMQARSQSARGWKSGLKYERGRFEFRLTDKAGDPVFLDDLRLFVGRPAFEQADVVLPFTHIGDGRYRVKRDLAPGTWAVRVIGGQGDRSYRRDLRLFVSKNNG
ncbi:MAG: FixH family protein [Hyphomicrobiaceae bacterium]